MQALVLELVWGLVQALMREPEMVLEVRAQVLELVQGPVWGLVQEPEEQLVPMRNLVQVVIPAG